MSSTTYISREKTRACTIHQAVMQRAIEYLNEEQFFSKKKVIQSLNFDAIASGIRWDYIIEFLRDGNEGESGVQLVPLKESFFTASKAFRETYPEKEYPHKYIAGGHGGKTVGYASVYINGGRFALHRHQWLSKMQNGVADAFTKYSEQLVARDLLEKPAVVRSLPATEKGQLDLLD